MTIKQAEIAAQEALEHLQRAEQTADAASRFLEDAKHEVIEAHKRRSEALKALEDARQAPFREAQVQQLTDRLKASLEAAEESTRGWGRSASPTLQDTRKRLERIHELRTDADRINVLRVMQKDVSNFRDLDKSYYDSIEGERYNAQVLEARGR